MPYIGVAPSSGLFKKLDAITVVNAQAAYTMQYNSSNFKPATAEQLIVSVNGVIQAPNDAYTVSGSTITFSENLVTGDVIDFIVALGEVGNTVTPVDGSVDINKMSSSLMTESGDVTTVKGVLSIDSSGNVGIGTTSPSAKLSITGLAMNSASSGVELEGAWPWLKFKDTETNQDSWLQYVDGSDYIIKQIDYDDRNSAPSTVGTERMRINSSGHVTIGKATTSESTDGHTFTEYGQAVITRASGYPLVLRVTGSATLAGFKSGSSIVGTISTNGSSTSYNTTSDYRLKENAVDMTGAITRVKSLQPKRFNFIDDTTDTLVDGFMAHEAATVVPEAVQGTHNEVDDDGNPVYQGIDQSKLVPLLTGALQEAIAKIEALETRVQALEDA
jgi:hypothetical protein